MIKTARSQLQNYVKVMKKSQAYTPLLVCLISYFTPSPAQDKDHQII